MAKSRQQKAEALEAIVGAMQSSKAVAFANFRGLTVKETEALRRKCAEAGVSYLVTPKRLLKLALAKVGMTGVDPLALEGEVATAFANADEIMAAKTLAQFAKDHEHLTLLGGILEGKALTAAEAKSLADIPGREELLGRLVGSLVSPMRGILSVMNGPQRGLVQVLSQLAQR